MDKQDRVSAAQALYSRMLLAPQFGILVGLALLVVVFQLLSGNFFTQGELGGASTIAATIGIIGVGVTMLMISGEFDLSVGAVAAFVSIIMGDLIVLAHWNGLLAFLVAMACGAAIGAINGLITLQFKLPSFITTLGTYFVFDGLNYIITGGNTVDVFSQATLFDVLGGQPRGSPFAAPFFWMLGLGLLSTVVLSNTQFGNWILAAGSRGGTAARAIGVPVNRVKLINFILCSSLAGFAGITAFAQYGSTSGDLAFHYNLIAILASVLGGTSLFGGRGATYGTMIGACVLGVLNTGLVLVGVPGTWYTVIIGLILVGAVILNIRLERIGRLLAIGARRAG